MDDNGIARGDDARNLPDGVDVPFFCFLPSVRLFLHFHFCPSIFGSTPNREYLIFNPGFVRRYTEVWAARGGIGMKKDREQSSNHEQILRRHLVELLVGGGAHVNFEDVVKDFPAKLRDKKPEKFPHTPWMLLEHLRIAQWDILEFSRNGKHVSGKWPDDYWPKKEAPPNAAAWNKSVQEFRRDLKAMQRLVANRKIDLYTKIPWGTGQTILREALLLADHNAYHVAQLVGVRRMLGAWKE